MGHDAVGLEGHLLPQVLHGVEHVPGVLDGQGPIRHEGGVDGLGHHAQQVDLLAGEDGDHVEQGVLHVAPEDVARHELGGRHVLEGRLGEDLPGHLGLSELVEEAVLPGGVDLEGVAQALLLLGEPGAQGELLVEELARQDRVGLLHRVRRGEIVVLARVDDDARKGVDPAGEALVDQRPLHVDIPEQDAVEGVVQHHVQPLQGAHGGDLRHAQA